MEKTRVMDLPIGALFKHDGHVYKLVSYTSSGRDNEGHATAVEHNTYKTYANINKGIRPPVSQLGIKIHLRTEVAKYVED